MMFGVVWSRISTIPRPSLISILPQPSLTNGPTSPQPSLTNSSTLPQQSLTLPRPSHTASSPQYITITHEPPLHTTSTITHEPPLHTTSSITHAPHYINHHSHSTLPQPSLTDPSPYYLNNHSRDYSTLPQPSLT